LATNSVSPRNFFDLPDSLGVARLGEGCCRGPGNETGARRCPDHRFDHLFDILDEVQWTAEEAYPPYNIERLDENRFQISVALAGFTPEEVALTAEQNALTFANSGTELAWIALLSGAKLSEAFHETVDGGGWYRSNFSRIRAGG